MSQVSRPMQVLLVVTVVFAAVWFVALRPKADDGSSAASEPAASAPAEPKSSLPGNLGDSVDKAKDVSRQSDAANAEREAAEQRATGETSGSTAPASEATQGSPASSTGGAAPADAPAAARPVARRRPASTATATPGSVAAAVADGKVAVVLFWDRRGSVDKQVRSELGPAGPRGRRVFVAAAPISQVSRFDVVTRGIQILQAPTVVVIGTNRQAQILSGYVDGAEIRQAVADALARR